MGPVKYTFSVSSGAGTLTLSLFHDTARYVRIIPTSETDTFNFKILDGDGHIMVSRTAQQGTYSEQVNLLLSIATTLSVSGASVDGTYTVKFDLGNKK